MLHIPIIRQNKKEIIELLKIRNFDASKLIDTLLEQDDSRKETQKELDELLAKSNQLSRKIGELYKRGEVEKANQQKTTSAEIKVQTKSLQDQYAALEKEITANLVQIPNVPHPSVPKGNTDADNKTIKEVGDVPTLIDGAKPHWELTTDYNLIDFGLGNKITGAGFPVYKDKGARLQRALINYFLDKNLAAGYTEYLPPHLVNEASGFGTGQLPDKEGQMYHITEDNLYLIPTAEVPVTNFFRDVIVKDFPIKCTAYTPCFRREAGSYGKDVRGLNRLHQFDKVEIVQIQHPEKSYDTLNEMVKHVSSILDELELPYKVLQLCGGDLGFTSALTYDFEVYSAGQDKWLEVSSVSNFESYQANRLKLRYKDEDGKTKLCHSLNGSALALPRIFAALLENNQNESGIKIPKVLQKYTGFDTIE
ncbi:MAG: serine--tRNA ligase [Flavobacteriales bacterium TMED123]|nr:MAG: serine--tRNA ligase [Flavobacteriales bacterium TMED123]|tara:strand:- start:21657 stop:22922 length:1266 start_codon:yes stop_codon:yes gene_type:complete